MGELPPGSQAFKWAAVAEKFRLPPPLIALLTPAQIDEILFYPRDQEGALVPPKTDKPKTEPTRESRLASIEQLRAMGFISEENAKALVAEVDAKYPDARTLG